MRTRSGSDLVRLDRGSSGNDQAQIILLQDPASIFNDGGPSAIAFNALCGSKELLLSPDDPTLFGSPPTQQLTFLTSDH
ncbi:MAG: hypothetical protein IPI91_20655 [Flavobacteriales bacterium]|nr:hypothetical protein [Flavobacteriales bacterium]